LLATPKVLISSDTPIEPIKPLGAASNHVCSEQRPHLAPGLVSSRTTGCIDGYEGTTPLRWNISARLASIRCIDDILSLFWVLGVKNRSSTTVFRARCTFRDHAFWRQKESPKHPSNIINTVHTTPFGCAVEPAFDIWWIMAVLLIVGSSYLRQKPVCFLTHRSRVARPLLMSHGPPLPPPLVSYVILSHKAGHHRFGVVGCCVIAENRAGFVHYSEP